MLSPFPTALYTIMYILVYRIPTVEVYIIMTPVYTGTGTVP